MLLPLVPLLHLVPLVLVLVAVVRCAAFATVLVEERATEVNSARERANHPSEGAPLIRRRKEPAWELV